MGVGGVAVAKYNISVSSLMSTWDKMTATFVSFYLFGFLY